MILNATNAYPPGEEDVSRDNETKGILKTIDQRRLTTDKEEEGAKLMARSPNVTLQKDPVVR